MDTASGLPPEFKGQDLKKKLIDCLNKESQQFSDIISAYLSKEKLSKEDRESLLQSVVTVVDQVLSAGDWDSSLFLRNTLKPLQAIKEEALIELDLLKTNTTKKSITTQSLAENEIE